MRTARCLTLIAIGAILTFAVSAHPSFLNLQIAGVVIMATGVAGLLLPRRNQPGWLRRRTILRRGLRGPVVGEVDETRLPPYVMLNPAAPAPTDLPADEVGVEHDTVVVEDRPATASEVVEEYIEE
jgi:hypothetical protein